jgi:hypothetical protein
MPALEISLEETQWRETPDPQWMLEFLGEKVSPRKLRLFACACARRALGLMLLERSRALVDVVEQFVDGEASWKECQTAERAARAGSASSDHESVEEKVRGAAWNTVRPDPHEGARYAASLTVQAFIARAFQERPGTIYSGTYLPEHHVQAALLRCIFGVPSRPVCFDPAKLAWPESTVVRLARTMYDERAFDQMPILGDALEDAGCTDAEILAHCRAAGEHVRGCWVLDLILGKS